MVQWLLHRESQAKHYPWIVQSLAAALEVSLLPLQNLLLRLLVVTLHTHTRDMRAAAPNTSVTRIPWKLECPLGCLLVSCLPQDT